MAYYTVKYIDCIDLRDKYGVKAAFGAYNRAIVQLTFLNHCCLYYIVKHDASFGCFITVL